MFVNPPKEKKWISWLYVIIGSLVIFATIPIARTLQRFVQDNWGRITFSYIVITVVILGGIAAIVYLIRQRLTTRSSYIWLTLISVILIGYTIRLSSAPEEALHFVEYAFLSLLIYRALTHTMRDVTIYFAAPVIGAIVGMTDEAIQWGTPGRFWGLDDIWLNFFAVSLIQIAIAKGFRPKIISTKPSPRNLKKLCLLTAAAVLFLGASLLNTPSRITWYANRIPIFKFLIENESVMFEYGHYYEHPEIGHFRSRLSPTELKQTDEKRAVEAAAILNQYRSDSSYSEFLKKYTPATDPFVHEARVHLFRRDRYLKRAKEETEDQQDFKEHVVVAYRENLIMEKYFTNTLEHSDYKLSTEELTFLENNHDPTMEYGSGVSWRLVTSINEFQIMMGLISSLLGCGFMYFYLSIKQKSHHPK